MALVVAEFFSIVGVDQTPPETMAELIAWMFTVAVGICLVSGVFRVIAKLAEVFLNWRRF